MPSTFFYICDFEFVINRRHEAFLLFSLMLLLLLLSVFFSCSLATALHLTISQVYVNVTPLCICICWIRETTNSTTTIQHVPIQFGTVDLRLHRSTSKQPAIFNIRVYRDFLLLFAKWVSERAQKLAKRKIHKMFLCSVLQTTKHQHWTGAARSEKSQWINKKKRCTRKQKHNEPIEGKKHWK